MRKKMKVFNCSGKLVIRMSDVEIEAMDEESARDNFIEALIEEADWHGDLVIFDCTEIEEENE